MTSTDADKLITAASQAVAERDRALEEAARLLHPDPVGVVADLLVQLWTMRDDRDAMTADLEAIRGMVGQPLVPIVEAVRQDLDDRREVKKDLRQQRDDANRYIGNIAVALGLSEYAPAVMVRDRAKDLRAETDRQKALLSTAEADAETQRTAAADLRDALDRVAEASGFGPDGAAPDIADRVIAEIKKLAGRPALTVERLASALQAANMTTEPTTAAIIMMATMSHVGGDLVLPEQTPTRQAALPADLRTYLETLLNRLQGTDGLAVAAETAALKRWIALPTAEVTP